MVLTLQFGADGGVTGTSDLRLGAEQIRRAVAGRYTVSASGEVRVEIREQGDGREVTYKGTLAGGQMSGAVLVSGKARGSFSARH